MREVKINRLPHDQRDGFCETCLKIFSTIPLDRKTMRETLFGDDHAQCVISLIAQTDDRIIGVLHAVLHQRVLFITVVGVIEGYRREQVASRLYENLLAECAHLDISEIRVSDYPYGYVLPGISDASGTAFFSSLGFQQDTSPLAMQRELKEFSYDEPILHRKRSLIGLGYEIVRYQECYLEAAIAFFERCMAPDWKDILISAHRSKRLIANGACCIDPTGIMIGASFYGVVGNDPMRFGPIGVDPERRGLSIGKILLEECLSLQYRDGLNRSYFLWCYGDSPAYRMYSGSGFTVMLKMQTMNKKF